MIDLPVLWISLILGYHNWIKKWLLLNITLQKKISWCIFNKMLPPLYALLQTFWTFRVRLITNSQEWREDIFNKANELSSLLIHTHKEVSLARKHNVKDLLQSFLHGLCIKKHSSNSSFISNKFLFEEDLGDGVNKNVQKGRSYRKFQKLQSGGQRPPKSMQRYPQYQGQRYKNLKAEARPRQNSKGKGTPRGDVQSRGRGRGQTQRGRGRGSRM